MTITSSVIEKINRLPNGYVFMYSDILEDTTKMEAYIKALNRLVDAGKLKKVGKGKYYKPEPTPFGLLEPDQYQIVKDLLEQNGKQIGYLTGLSIYPKLGLSTQISNTIQIGKNNTRPEFKRGKFTISFVQQKNRITKENVPSLQLLDSIRYIKKIPDTSTEQSCRRLLSIVSALSNENKISLIKLAAKYPAATRALLGALLEENIDKKKVEILKSSLNPITVYKIDGITNVLSQAINWNIK